jgi:hypothetical protein
MQMLSANDFFYSMDLETNQANEIDHEFETDVGHFIPDMGQTAPHFITPCACGNNLFGKNGSLVRCTDCELVHII